MTCPLSALANIAAITAECAPVMRYADITSSSPPSSPRAMAAAAADASAMISTRSRPDGTKTAAMPLKKRSVTVANLEPSSEDGCAPRKKRSAFSPNLETSSDLHGIHTMSNEKTKKSKKATWTTPSETKGEGEFTTFELEAGEPSFPVILMGIMSAPQNMEFISFLSDGQSFVIVHPEALANYVLPVHFEGASPKLDQFLHLLAMWGFEAVDCPQHPEVYVFKHPMFRKGDWEACLRMEMPREERNIASQSQADYGLPAEDGQAPARTEWHQPPSPRREFSLADAAYEGRFKPKAARSVTPPEHLAAPPSGMLRRRAADPSATRDATASQWMVQSSALEQMIKNTAATRRRLSGSLEELILGPELQSMYRHGVERSSALRYPNADATAPAVPKSARGLQPVTSFTPESRLTDAQVQLVTKDVVSAAVAALNGSKQQERERCAPGGNALVSPTSSCSSLDMMTEAFLERSNARRIRSRPAGIRGLSSSVPLSDVADTQTRALLARQRELFLTMA